MLKIVWRMTRIVYKSIDSDSVSLGSLRCSFTSNSGSGYNHLALDMGFAGLVFSFQDHFATVLDRLMHQQKMFKLVVLEFRA
jgi:hypothetical protein